MKIHVSEPCKQLLPAQYKLTPRDEPELRDKVGGHASHFLDSKDGRQPLRQEVIKALLPTDSEMPKLVSKMQTSANFEKDQFHFNYRTTKRKKKRKRMTKRLMLLKLMLQLQLLEVAEMLPKLTVINSQAFFYFANMFNWFN